MNTKGTKNKLKKLLFSGSSLYPMMKKSADKKAEKKPERILLKTLLSKASYPFTLPYVCVH